MLTRLQSAASTYAHPNIGHHIDPGCPQEMLSRHLPFPYASPGNQQVSGLDAERLREWSNNLMSQKLITVEIPAKSWESARLQIVVL